MRTTVVPIISVIGTTVMWIASVKTGSKNARQRLEATFPAANRSGSESDTHPE